MSLRTDNELVDCFDSFVLVKLFAETLKPRNSTDGTCLPVNSELTVISACKKKG